MESHFSEEGKNGFPGSAKPSSSSPIDSNKDLERVKGYYQPTQSFNGPQEATLEVIEGVKPFNNDLQSPSPWGDGGIQGSNLPYGWHPPCSNCPYIITEVSKRFPSVNHRCDDPHCWVRKHHKKIKVAQKQDLGYPAVPQDYDWVDYIPGGGESYLTCGKTKFVTACENPGCWDHQDHVVDLHPFDCHRRECPVCWDRPIHDEAERAFDRIMQAMGLYRDAGINIKAPRHVIFSPPQDWAIDLVQTPEGFKKLRDKALKVLKGAGLTGGAVIFHKYRIKKDLEKELRKVGYGTGKKDSLGGKWDGVRADALGLGSWDEYVYASPHFHVVGWGFLVKSSKLEKDTGWVYKNKGSCAGYIKNVLFYALSHGFVVPNNEVYNPKMLTYFGLLGYNKIVIDKEWVEEEYEPCEVCGEPKVKYRDVNTAYGDEGPYDPIDPFECDPYDSENWLYFGVYTKKVKHRIYKLKEPPGGGPCG